MNHIVKYKSIIRTGGVGESEFVDFFHKGYFFLNHGQDFISESVGIFLHTNPI